MFGELEESTGYVYVVCNVLMLYTLSLLPHKARYALSYVMLIHPMPAEHTRATARRGRPQIGIHGCRYML